MKVEIKLGPRAEWQTVEAKRDITLEELYIECAGRKPDEDQVVAVKIDNQYRSLTNKLTKGCRVEFLDISMHAGRLVYQYGLIMIYLKAIEESIGRSHVEVQYALSKGLYTEIDGGREVSDEELDAIRAKMDEIVAKDIPFIMGTADRDRALVKLEEAGLTEKLRLLKGARNVKTVNYFKLENFYNLFYGYMVPSTRYISGFELKRYRRGILLVLPVERAGSGLAYIDDRKLYNAFEQTQKWQRLLHIPFVTDLNLKVEAGEAKDIIQLSEALHEQNIIELAQRIVKEKKRVILISGPSSSGKTTFARRLCIQLRVNGLEPLYMGTDDYFLDREFTPVNEKGEKDFECLEAVDIELFNQNMNDLLAGKEVDIPVFDFIDGRKKFGQRITSIKPGTPIVIEGIHALNKKFTPKIDDKQKFKIYISPLTQLNIDNHNRISVTDSRMLRRIVRDYQFRGYSAEKTIKNWPNVRAGENVNVFPYNGEADVFINSMHVYEIGVLKKYAKPLLEAIGKDSEQYAEAQRLLAFLRFFKVIEHDEYIPNNSLLREFIGGSIFV